MKTLIKYFIFLFPSCLIAQSNSVGFHIKPGTSQMTRFVTEQDFPEHFFSCELCDPVYIPVGSLTYEHTVTLSFSTSFNYTIGNHFSLESGISFFNRSAKSSSYPWKQDRPLLTSGSKQVSLYFLDIPLILNFHYKSLYIGTGVSLNFFSLQRERFENDVTWGTKPGHNVSRTSFSFIAQTGYTHKLNDKLSLRGGLYFNYLYSNTEFKNYGVDLGVLFQLDNKSSR